MFDEFRKRVRNWMEKAKAVTGIAKEFKDIFELGGVPAFNQFYYFRNIYLEVFIQRILSPVAGF